MRKGSHCSEETRKKMSAFLENCIISYILKGILVIILKSGRSSQKVEKDSLLCILKQRIIFRKGIKSLGESIIMKGRYM